MTKQKIKNAPVNSRRGVNQMSRKSLMSCKKTPGQRWGQSIANNFKLTGEIADRLFYEHDEAVILRIIEEMIRDYQLE
jgi:hypothetical protein